jgi:hypothetical protein
MRVRDAFAWPFKVLRDRFTDPPIVPDPKFTRFDLGALQAKHDGGIPVKRGKIRVPLLLLLLVATVIALILLG